MPPCTISSKDGGELTVREHLSSMLVERAQKVGLFVCQRYRGAIHTKNETVSFAPWLGGARS